MEVLRAKYGGRKQAKPLLRHEAASRCLRTALASTTRTVEAKLCRKIRQSHQSF